MSADTANPYPSPPTPALSGAGRVLILICAFLGWMCAGFHMSITSLAMQPAATDLLDRAGQIDAQQLKLLNMMLAEEKASKGAAKIPDVFRRQAERGNALVARWFAWCQCAWLLGAASGGLFFGWLGDRIGRSKAMALSILTYSAMAAATYAAQLPWQLIVLWYLACTGVGGMWPNGVALMSEAWSNLSRPMTAGLIGTSANIGILLMATVISQFAVVPENWRWVMLVGASPFVLGVFALLAVPESTRWLAARRDETSGKSNAVSSWEVFRPPLLHITLIGILLATIPILGGWGVANWMVPWADNAGAAASPPNPFLKAHVNQARALTGIVGSLLGGWIATIAGRRRTYFFTSLAALAIAQYTFWFAFPTDRWFLAWVAALGFFSGIYFGWMPLFLPELFPTRSRSTGAGVSFNFGRIITVATVFAAGALMHLFEGDYARIGRVTSLIFALGLVAIWLAPDTSRKQLED